MDCDETPADTLSRSHTLIQLHTVTDIQQSSLLDWCVVLSACISALLGLTFKSPELFYPLNDEFSPRHVFITKQKLSEDC